MKAVFDCRVSQDALPMFEPDEVKVSRPVLRGLGAGNSPRLPGDKPQMFKVQLFYLDLNLNMD